MESEPIRVLHVLGRLNMGGAETRIMDLYRHMDREKVQFDFLVHYKRTQSDQKNGVGTDSEALLRTRPQEDYDAEALSLGAHIYVLPRFTGTNLPEYRRACHAFFAAHHEWAVIEGHMTSMASVYLPIAKEEAEKAAAQANAAKGPSDSAEAAAGGGGEGTRVVIPVTIAHARSAGTDPGIRGLATRIFRRSLPEKCDIMMSCSGPASVSVFGKRAAESGRVMVVPNALDLDVFRYDSGKREQVRAEYGISEDTLVIGHVGRFDPVKNQAFLARVCAEMKKRSRQKVLFFFAGKGDLQESVREAFEKEDAGKNVIFAGQLAREKTAAAYQAFDVFVLPSLYEGLPGTVIEAQSAGLPCVIADTITEEVAVTDLVRRLALDDPAAWAQAILEAGEGGGNTADALSGEESGGTQDAAARAGGGTDEENPSGGGKPGAKPQRPKRDAASDEALPALAAAGYEIRSAARRMQKLYQELAGKSR